MSKNQDKNTISIATATLVFSSQIPDYKIDINQKNLTRENQEKLLIGEKILHKEGEFEENITENKDNLPKSCFTIFKLGVINNLKETGKCFGLNR